MSFDEGYAIGRNRHWGVQLNWLVYTNDICEQLLGGITADGRSGAFARAIYDWQDDQLRLTADGVVGPRTWRMLRRQLRATRVPIASESLPGAQAALNAFLFAPANNSPHRTSDARGMFHPASRVFERMHNTAATHRFDNHDDNTSACRRSVFDAFEAAPGGLDAVVYFGHGAPHGLLSAGILMRHLGAFASLIRAKSGPRCKVLLYACSCGAPGGFAERLAAELGGNAGDPTPRFEVYAHTVPGRAHINPTKIVYPEGQFIVEPGTPLFPRWRHALSNNHLWARYPFMTEEAVRAAL